MADTFTIIDNRTGKSVEVPIEDGGIAVQGHPRAGCRPVDLRPGVHADCSVPSAITYIDGDAGILRYRGYPIEQLAEHSTYLEVAYLLLNGELPNKAQSTSGPSTSPTTRSSTRTCASVHGGLPLRRPPDGHVRVWVAALRTFYPDAKDIDDPTSREKQILRLIAKSPTLAAYCHRFSRRPAHGLPRQLPRLHRRTSST